MGRTMPAVVSVHSRRVWAALISVALALTALVAIRPAPATALVQETSPIRTTRERRRVFFIESKILCVSESAINSKENALF